jgi:hypothetical protein
MTEQRKRWRGKTERYKKEDKMKKMDISFLNVAVAILCGNLQQRKRARQNQGRGGEERHKDTKRKIECEQIYIFTHHTAAEALFGRKT